MGASPEDDGDTAPARRPASASVPFEVSRRRLRFPVPPAAMIIEDEDPDFAVSSYVMVNTDHELHTTVKQPRGRGSVNCF